MGKNDRHNRQKPREKKKAQAAARRPESSPAARPGAGTPAAAPKGSRAVQVGAAPPVERWAALETPPKPVNYLGELVGPLFVAMVPWLFLGGAAAFCAIEITNSAALGGGPLRGDLLTLALAFALIGIPAATCGLALVPSGRLGDAARAKRGGSVVLGPVRAALAEVAKALEADEKPVAYLGIEPNRTCTGDALSVCLLIFTLISSLLCVVILPMSMIYEPFLAVSTPAAFLLPQMALEVLLSATAGLTPLAALFARVLPAGVALVIMSLGPMGVAILKANPLVPALALIQLVRGLTGIASSPYFGALLVTTRGLRVVDIGPAGGVFRVGAAQVPAVLRGVPGPFPGEIALLDAGGRELLTVRPQLACLAELAKACREAGYEVKVEGAQRELDFNESIDGLYAPWLAMVTLGCAMVCAPSLPVFHYSMKLSEAARRFDKPTDAQIQAIGAVSRKYPHGMLARTALITMLSTSGRKAEAATALAEAKALAAELAPGLADISLGNSLANLEKQLAGGTEPAAGG